MKTTYRAHTILYYDAAGWLAFIYPPGMVNAKGSAVQASRHEGQDVLLERVRARIDQDAVGRE
jgi:hypothetical protein